MAGGTGNDILLDDICISICYPNIELLTNSTFSRMADTVRTCQTDTAIRLYALNRNNIQTYISNPIYLFQYKNRQSAEKWVDLDTTALAAGVLHHYTSVNTDSVRLSKADKRFWRDTTIFRVMVTSAQNVIDSICKGHLPVVNCDSVYAIDSMAVIYHYSGAMGPDFSKAACEGDTFSVKGVANFKPYATWYNGDGVKLVKMTAPRQLLLMRPTLPYCISCSLRSRRIPPYSILWEENRRMCHRHASCSSDKESFCPIFYTCKIQRMSSSARV